MESWMLDEEMESWMLDEEMEKELYALFNMQIFFWPINKN